MAIDELNKIANLSDEEKEKLNISWYGDMWKQMYLDYHNENRKDGLFFDAGTVIVVLSKFVQNACIAAAHMEKKKEFLHKKTVLVTVTVPAPRSFRITEFPWAGTFINTLFSAIAN